MNPYGIPALIAAILNLVLAMVAVAFRRREPIHSWFALFTGMIALDAFVNFLVTQVGTPQVLPHWLVTAILISSTFAFVATLGFVLALTGYLHDLRARVLGVPVWAQIVVLAVIFVAVTLLSIFSDLLITEVAFTPTGMKVEMGPGAVVFQLFMALVLVIVFALPISAIRRQASSARRRFIATVTAGLGVMYVVAAVFELILSQVGYYTQFVSYLGFTVAAIIFYAAMLRYQFDRVDELNIHLEEKVQERTRSLREAQARLVQSETSASLGRLAAGLSHEYNTPVGVIRSGASTLRHGLGRLRGLLEAEPEPVAAEELLRRLEDTVKVVDEGGRRVATITARLRSFSKLDEAELQMEDLEQALEDALFLLDHEQKAHLTVEREYAGVGEVACYASQLNQALLNILTNAAEAAGPGGRIVLSTRREKDEAVLEVGDDGPGMEPEVLRRAPDPGFTTKSRGVGAGLGLAIAQQVLLRHHGRLEIESEPGAGTTVRLRLPSDLPARLREPGDGSAPGGEGPR